MSRRAKRRMKKVGLPAGSLVYTGEQAGGTVKVTLIEYDEGSFAERTIQKGDEIVPFQSKSTITWINVNGVHDAAVLETIGERFGLHRLVIEDLMNVVQRPKVEDFGDYLFIVLKKLSFDEQTGAVVPEQVSLIVGQNYLLSFQEGVRDDVFPLIRDRLHAARGRIRKGGADYLAYSLIDALVDGYFVSLEKLGDRIDLLEEEVVSGTGTGFVERLYHVKRELLFLHKAVWPLREVVSSLVRSDSDLIQESTTPYLRDVYDHLGQAVDSVEIEREILTELVDIHLSATSNRLNEVMKVLTVIATIFMPLTFIAGIYGMNFRHMPELTWRYGYLFVWLVMAGVGVGMYFFFKRKKWM